MRAKDKKKKNNVLGWLSFRVVDCDMKKMLVGHCLGMSSMVRTRAPLHLEVVKKCTIVDSIDSIDSRISVSHEIDLCFSAGFEKQRHKYSS